MINNFTRTLAISDLFFTSFHCFCEVRVAALICLSTILEDSPLSKIVVSIRTLRKRTGFSVAERNAKIVHGLHHGLLNGARKETGSTLIQVIPFL